jgi:hypothetical protein
VIPMCAESHVQHNNLVLAHVTPTTLSRHGFRDAAVYTRVPQDSAGCPPAVSVGVVVLCIAYPTPAASGTCPRDCAVVHSLGCGQEHGSARRSLYRRSDFQWSPLPCLPHDERMPCTQVSVPRRWDGPVRVPESQRSFTSSPSGVPDAPEQRTRKWTHHKGGILWILSIQQFWQAVRMIIVR